MGEDKIKNFRGKMNMCNSMNNPDARIKCQREARDSISGKINLPSRVVKTRKLSADRIDHIMENIFEDSSLVIVRDALEQYRE